MFGADQTEISVEQARVERLFPAGATMRITPIKWHYRPYERPLIASRHRPCSQSRCSRIEALVAMASALKQASRRVDEGCHICRCVSTPTHETREVQSVAFQLRHIGHDPKLETFCEELVSQIKCSQHAPNSIGEALEMSMNPVANMQIYNLVQI
jgi:hypothetical protein